MTGDDVDVIEIKNEALPVTETEDVSSGVTAEEVYVLVKESNLTYCENSWQNESDKYESVGECKVDVECTQPIFEQMVNNLSDSDLVVAKTHFDAGDRDAALDFLSEKSEGDDSILGMGFALAPQCYSARMDYRESQTGNDSEDEGMASSEIQSFLPVSYEGMELDSYRDDGLGPICHNLSCTGYQIFEYGDYPAGIDGIIMKGVLIDDLLTEVGATVDLRAGTSVLLQSGVEGRMFEEKHESMLIFDANDYAFLLSCNADSCNTLIEDLANTLIQESR